MSTPPGLVPPSASISDASEAILIEAVAPPHEQAAALLARRETRRGLLFGLGAYLWWGVAPLYFHLVSHVPALTVLSHRIVWSVVFLGLLIAFQRRWREAAAVLRDRRLLGWLTVSALLIAVNWYTFIYAVETGRVLQASLGYYMTPLISVLLGWTVLRERLRAWQWLSVLLAAIGVLISASGGTGVPWIALVLAGTFSLYGLLRKLARIGPLIGLLVETLVLLAPALVLVARDLLPGANDAAGLDGALSAGTYGLLMLAGVITAVPLLGFAAAAKRLRLSTLGFLQYVAPSVQFLMAVIVLGEGMDARRALAFALIWTALAVFSVDSWRSARRR